MKRCKPTSTGPPPRARVGRGLPTGTRDVLAQRVGQRTAHFMPLALLDSQLATLQPGVQCGSVRKKKSSQRFEPQWRPP